MTGASREAGGLPLRRMLLFLCLGLPVSALLAFLAVRGAHLDRVGDAMRDAERARLATAVVVLVGVSWLQASRWRILAGRVRTTGWHLSIVWSSLCVNNVLPGRIGDLLRARWLSHDARIPGGRSLASVVLDRSLDVIVLAAGFLLLVPFTHPEPWVLALAGGGGAVLVVAAAIALVLRRVTRHGPRDRPQHGRARRILGDTAHGLVRGVPRVALLSAVVLTALIWLAWALAAWLVLESLGVRLQLHELLLLTTALNLGTAVPAAPGFVGAYQWLCVATLSLYDVEREPALAFSLLLHASWYIPSTLIGAAMLLRRSLAGLRVAPAGDTG
jgi:uncharacterized membrane protein YbhN (UPF0104 family)